MKNLTTEEISDRMDARRKMMEINASIEDLLGIAFSDGRTNAESVFYIKRKLPAVSIRKIISVAIENGF